MKILARVLTALLAALLATMTCFGFADGLNVVRAARSPLQWVAVATEWLYAIGAPVALWLMVRRDRRQLPALIVVAFAMTVTAILAPVVWGGAGWSVGLISGIVVLVVMAGLIGGRAALQARMRVRQSVGSDSQ